MADTVPSLSSYPQDPPAWRMPVLVALALLGVFVLGGVTFMVLTQNTRPTPQAQDNTLVSRVVGTPIDPEKAQAAVDQVLAQENEFLTYSFLRNTYSGLLEEINQFEAVESTDDALELVINISEERKSFFLTKQILEEKTRFYLFDNRQSPPVLTEISSADIQTGWGVSITMVNDLLQGQDYIHEMIVEVTPITSAP